MLAATKVHIRGLDVMKPDDIKAYVAEHFTESPFERIEWIDDSSGNLLFASEPVAARALEALSLEPIQDVALLPPRQLIPAKPFTQMPDVHLQVRLAVLSDKKQAGAAQRSRFYLLNPEYDPEERHRRGDTRRFRDRDGGGGYGRRRGRHSTRGDDEHTEPFDVSLYDDDEASRASRAPRSSRPRRRRSYTPDSERSEPRRRRSSYRGDHWSTNRGKELFPLDSSSSSNRRDSHRDRDRSASPGRDRDGDRSMDMDDALSNEGSASTARNRDQARAIRSHKSRSNRSRELFPEKTIGSGSNGGRLGDGGVEDAAELMAKGITLPLMDGSSDVKPDHSSYTTTTFTSPSTSTRRPRRLEDRITAPGQGQGKGGSLAARISSPSQQAAGAASAGSSFSIRGAASQKSADQGFAIKGVAGGNKSVKELFPDKFSGSGANVGKELFADRLEGRTRQRQRAGDLFD